MGWGGVKTKLMILMGYWMLLGVKTKLIYFLWDDNWTERPAVLLDYFRLRLFGLLVGLTMKPNKSQTSNP